MEKEMEMEEEVPEVESEEMDEYECKHAADIVLQAEEIKADPKKWAEVKKHLLKKKAAISSIAQLREIAHGNEELPSKKKKSKV